MFTSYVIDIARCSYKVPLSPGLENCSSEIHNKDVGQQNTKPIRQKPIENALPASAHSALCYLIITIKSSEFRLTIHKFVVEIGANAD